jgi:hypothetical protein
LPDGVLPSRRIMATGLPLAASYRFHIRMT